jgi:hypothetical protein
MPPKSHAVLDDIVKALQDDAVLSAIGSIFDSKLKDLLHTLHEVKTENTQLRNDLNAANQHIEKLEAYSRRDNLIVSGLPLVSYSEAAAMPPHDGNGADHTSTDTEKAFLSLCNDTLGLPTTSADISVAHRLPSHGAGKSPSVIVRFTNRKARDAVYRAKRQLKNAAPAKIFINEDLTKHVAGLFFTARSLIKQGRLASAWTNGGVLYVKLTKDPACKPTKIGDSGDFPG